MTESKYEKNQLVTDGKDEIIITAIGQIEIDGVQEVVYRGMKVKFMGEILMKETSVVFQITHENDMWNRSEL